MNPDIFKCSYRLLNKYNQVSQKPKQYGTEDVLYPAEVHMIAAIGSHGEITTTALSQFLGITKGAVSQTTNKLQKKQLIEKQVSSEKKTEIRIQLTEKGKIVFEYHRNMHRSAEEKIRRIMDTLSPESLSAIGSVIAVFDEMLDEM